ncbi:hypothetical protein BAE44_0014241 [Dichanthelium oligosanthes]|uniref:Uncharacterized protein n=1 Tax=Dichanthelium oligosanthes TaxID=888268 RepID=A0A1E5VHY6_9POAL|nr:hypothetical protein BAE44_0014241 [Dichanthelium oligosanthes]
MDNVSLLRGIMATGVAGAVFGAGWSEVSFLHCLTGIFASLAAYMFNCVDKDEIGYDYYSPYGNISGGGLDLPYDLNPRLLDQESNIKNSESNCIDNAKLAILCTHPQCIFASRII